MNTKELVNGNAMPPLAGCCEYENCHRDGVAYKEDHILVVLCNLHKRWFPEIKKHIEYKNIVLNACYDEMSQHNSRMNKAAISLLEEIEQYKNEQQNAPSR